MSRLPDLRALRAVLFDLDGVITDTAAVHARAWQLLFDRFFAARGAADSPFRLPDDYVAHVDGKPRYQGVQSVLRARGIDLPFGAPADPPEALTVCGLGNRKNQIFNRILDQDGVEVFAGSVALVRWLRAAGVRIGCVSSSKNCRPVLDRVGLSALFDVIVDGFDLEHEHLAGKPSPDGFLHAAARVEVAPATAGVIEDAVAGVAAGRAGGFKLVVGVDRGAGKVGLRAAGADVVVDDLSVFLM